MAIPLLPTSFAQDNETFSLTILHTNDTHSHHEPQRNGNGGVARQASVVNQIRAEGGNTILLDAGDRFTGTLFHQQYRGADQIEIMNALGYDAIALGNHEFDDGESTLEAFVQGLNFAVLSANTDFSAFPTIDEIVAPYTILTVGDQQIGVIGLTTPDTPITSSPSDEVIFNEDLVGVTQQYVEELTAAGVNKIILLTHVGITVDTDLVSQLSGIDIIVGGHSHTLLSNTYADAELEYPLEFEGADGNPILYVQAGEKNIYLGRLDVTFNSEGVLVDWGGDVILLSRYITPDPEMQALVDELAEPVNELRNQPIGAVATELLVGDRSVCRIEECALGNIITDAIRLETGADIVIQNGGGIRADIDAGEITVGEVLTVLPFGNTIATVTLTGEQVIAALENGVSAVTVGEGGVISRSGLNGRFPQVSGLRYTFDPTQEVGSRIVSVEVLNQETGEYEPIDPEAVYFVATNDFMLNGGDGYSVFAEGAGPYPFGRPLEDATIDYLVSLGEVSPYIEGRITLVNATIE
ncbi:MAG: multifunctional 2',3'-cyclic-nucleotide 2'-phosphodiesterase/5'-nucleotidase/3'-nucleotidase [Phototrophicales bacterium]|nr:MAG: multifunctional 2',3'-cyclic-nucleotide 2'-phosphodiesterase/5'-nucleotidase/3'-nucleotidase [Phototrophicales bacterium]